MQLPYCYVLLQNIVTVLLRYSTVLTIWLLPYYAVTILYCCYNMATILCSYHTVLCCYRYGYHTMQLPYCTVLTIWLPYYAVTIQYCSIGYHTGQFPYHMVTTYVYSSVLSLYNTVSILYD